VVRSGLTSQLAEQISRPVKPQDHFLSLSSALGDLHATGQQKSDPVCRTSFGKDRGMALELHFLRIHYDSSAIRTGNFREGLEALHRIQPPFQYAIEPRPGRTVLNSGSCGHMPDNSICGREYCSRQRSLTHV
jgi:hypothetical protein